MNDPPQTIPCILADVAAHPGDFCTTVTLSSGETLTFCPLLGVMAHNHQEIYYYQKHGFEITGEFHKDANIV